MYADTEAKTKQAYYNNTTTTEHTSFVFSKSFDKYASLVTLSHVHLGKFRLEPYLENPLPRGGLVILIF